MGNAFTLTNEQKQEFMRIYPNTTNITLQEKYGLSVNTISRLAKKFGVKKDSRFIKCLSKNKKIGGGAGGKSVSMKCWDCVCATNPPDHRCSWPDKFIIPDGAETIERAYFQDGETCMRTYIANCPNFERG